jgi:hypothetical protein
MVFPGIDVNFSKGQRMNARTAPNDVLPHVIAQLNYLAPMAEKPVAYTYDPPPGVPRSNASYDAHEVPIRDARPLRDSLSLDVEGFVLVDHLSAVRDFWDDDEVRATYYPETERLIRVLTGARRASVFDHMRRRRPAHRPPLDGSRSAFSAVREPVGRVHADFTTASSPARARFVWGDAVEPLLRERFAILNVWRPLNPEPLLDAPLAVADARSIAPEDLVASDLVYRERTGETYSVKYNPEHRWFYFPRQRGYEAIVFKNFDSATDGKARVSPHTAFEDPQTPAGAPPRESIELRVFAFFGAEA